MSKAWRRRLKKLRDEIKEGIFHILPEQIRVSVIRSRCSPAKERGYTPRGNVWFYLCEHREDMRRWDGKPNSSLAARVCELKRGTTTTRNSSRLNAALISCEQDFRWYRSDDVMSNHLEGTSRSYLRDEHSVYHDQNKGGPASSQTEERDNRVCWTVWF
ncbi:hypothetical protein WISP_102173 [Willisornis vidua]|uniref:Uncharacterized protein n=1 Tax=Willisornis vidua TaxID=1566151 RepID=A0ABQ9D121_9PASS|nr:hypothetical protein WISP_102173 [Willisornis vidua]